MFFPVFPIFFRRSTQLSCLAGTYTPAAIRIVQRQEHLHDNENILFLTAVLFCLLTFGSKAQEITTRTLENGQPFSAMQGSTADIIQVLPGEKIIENATIDGKTVLFCTENSGKRTKIYQGNRIGHFSHSQNGERICFEIAGEFIVKDINSGQEFRFQTVDPVYVSRFVSISPDGDKIVFDKTERHPKGHRSVNDHLIVIKDLKTGEERIITKGGCSKWSPTSQQIVFLRSDGYIAHWTDYLWVINSDGSGLRKLNSAIHLGGARVQWSPDGKYVMDSDRQGNLRIVDVKKDEAVIVPPSRFGNVPDAIKEYMGESWSPDGKTILARVIVVKDITTIDSELYLISVDRTKIEKIDIPGLNKEIPVFLNSSELLFRNSQQGNVWNKTTIKSTEQLK
jgi:WD40 repeat protein